MKSFILLVLVVVGVSSIWITFNRKVHAQDKERFELISNENHHWNMLAFHDKETGKEYICVGWSGISCAETGRVWK